MIKRNWDVSPARIKEKKEFIPFNPPPGIRDKLKKIRKWNPRKIIAFSLIFIFLLWALLYLIFNSRWKEANYKWGLENLSKGNFEEAERNFERAAEGKNEGDVLFRLAVSKYNQKDYKGAIEAYNQALSKNPQNPSLYNGLGNVYRDQKNFDLAKEYYLKSISVDENYIVAYSNLAIMLIDQGKKQEASEVISRAIKSNPGSVELGNLKKIADEQK